MDEIGKRDAPLVFGRRQHELETLRKFFALTKGHRSTSPKRGGIFLITGIEGVGKTQLAREFVKNEVRKSQIVHAIEMTETTLGNHDACHKAIRDEVHRFGKVISATERMSNFTFEIPSTGRLAFGITDDGLDLNSRLQDMHKEWGNKSLIVFIVEVQSIPDESDGNDRALFDVMVRYDWARHEVAVRMDGKLRFPVTFTDLADKVLFSIDTYDQDDWQLCDQSSADHVRDAIQRSSFLNVQCNGVSWRILVREESFSHRPSLLLELSPDEILEYWSLLTPEQRTAFLERRMVDSIEGLSTSSGQMIDTTESVFHQFSGIFHAFGHLRRHLCDCLENERVTDAEYRVFGAKYDSMPELLRKMIEKEDGDPLFVYITFLTAKQL